MLVEGASFALHLDKHSFHSVPTAQGDIFVPLLLRQGGLHLDSVKQLV